ncbi:VIT domain-containing protein [Pseudomonadota bacterium]
MSIMAQALTGVNGERVALSNVAVSAALQDLLADVTVSQTYHNQENANIEAVYTFPLPLDAVLLDLQVEIAGRVLKGVVVKKAAAEERYEEAIEDGDSAVMLEEIEPGLYTMNVGNLMPDEQATITFRYAMLYHWIGDRLRIFLPTTIAPRYGYSPHQPHQEPEHSLTVENQFTLDLRISGGLKEAQFSCPSHDVHLARFEDEAVISLHQERAVMDRDFILNVKAPPANRSFAICGMDGDDAAVVASFQPFFPGLQQPRPLDLAVLIDCSGSMGGDSMDQARQALAGMIDALRPDDRVTLIAFGSTTRILSKKLLPCNRRNLAKMKSFASKLDADMGGTEIGGALRKAYKATKDSQRTDIFLVTDGEVGSWQQVVDEARVSGNRIFTVGVGSAVSEAFVRKLASETGGHCELVSPREGMADRVIRHFERMRTPRAKQIRVRWPEGAFGMAPSKQGAIFEGDTIVTSAQFKQASIGDKVDLEVETEKGEIFHQEVQIRPAPSTEQPNRLSPVARVVAALRLRELEGDSAIETAERYQLISPWTNWLVIAERSPDEKAQEIPKLRKVPHTLAAGWGGMGIVGAKMSVSSVASRSANVLASEVMCDIAPESSFLKKLRQQTTRPEGPPTQFRLLLDLIYEDPYRLHPDNTMALLAESGLLSELHELLDLAGHLGLEPNLIATLIFQELFKGSLGEFLPSPAHDGFARLQNQAGAARQSLNDISRCGIRLVEAAERAMRDGVLRQESSLMQLMQHPDYFFGLRELLSLLEECEPRCTRASV